MVPTGFHMRSFLARVFEVVWTGTTFVFFKVRDFNGLMPMKACIDRTRPQEVLQASGSSPFCLIVFSSIPLRATGSRRSYRLVKTGAPAPQMEDQRRNIHYSKPSGR